MEISGPTQNLLVSTKRESFIITASTVQGVESVWLRFINEGLQCFFLFPRHRSLRREKIKEEMISQSYRISLWEHLVLTSLCPNSAIPAAALTKYTAPGLSKSLEDTNPFTFAISYAGVVCLHWNTTYALMSESLFLSLFLHRWITFSRRNLCQSPLQSISPKGAASTCFPWSFWTRPSIPNPIWIPSDPGKITWILCQILYCKWAKDSHRNEAQIVCCKEGAFCRPVFNVNVYVQNTSPRFRLS